MALTHVSILVLGTHTNKPCTARSWGRSLLLLHPAMSPARRREMAGKQGMGGGRGGGAAPEKSQPRHVSDPSARAGLAGRCGQRLGTASCRQSRRRRSPGVPGGLAEWKSFPSSSKKEKFFLHLITPVAARRVGEWVGLGASKGGSGRCCVVGSRRRRALLPNPTLPSKTLS